MRTRIALAAVALFLLPAAARADTVTFDDVLGFISADRYLAQGVRIGLAGPVVSGASAHTAPNYLSPAGPDLFGSYGMVIRFSVPGSLNAYTTSFGFYVVGPTAAPYTITPLDHLGNFLPSINSSEVGVPHFFSGTFYGGFILTTRQAGIGIDTLTFGPVERVVPTPEPATLLLLGTGLAGVAAKARKRRKG